MTTAQPILAKLSPIIDSWLPPIAIFFAAVIIIAISYMIRNWYIGDCIRRDKTFEVWQILNFDGADYLLVNIGMQRCFFMKFEDLKKDDQRFEKVHTSLQHIIFSTKTVTNKGYWVMHRTVHVA